MLRRHPSVRATGASLHWSIEDPRELETRIPKLELLISLTAYDPNGYDPAQVARMSWAARLTVRLFAVFPSLGRSSRLLCYRF